MDFQLALTACPRHGSINAILEKVRNIYIFIASVVLVQQILAGLGKVTGRQSLVL